MTTNSGAAREVPTGRLAAFEDSDDDVPTTPLLPPRRQRRPLAIDPVIDPAPTTDAPPRSAPTRALPPKAQPPAPAEQPRSIEAPNPAEAADVRVPEQGTKGPEDRIRASNVHIPVALLEPLTAACKEGGLSHGEIIIIAIENSYDRLKDLIHPAATAGGQVFASRRSRASRTTDGPLTPLNYRLREGDYATLDDLVEKFGASSRGHLITTALTDYLGNRNQA